MSVDPGSQISDILSQGTMEFLCSEVNPGSCDPGPEAMEIPFQLAASQLTSLHPENTEEVTEEPISITTGTSSNYANMTTPPKIHKHVTKNTSVSEMQQIQSQALNLVIHPAPTVILVSPSRLSSMPIGEDYGFSVSVEFIKKMTKSCNYAFSERLQKVFVRHKASCPFLFKTSRATPPNTSLRATLIFLNPKDQNTPVRRCANHVSAREKNNEDSATLTHVLHYEGSKDACYAEDSATGVRSVSVRYEPYAVSEWQTIVYSFWCFSTCAGLDRRPLQIVFTLECGQGFHCVTIGRCALEVRISACPGRDIRMAEEGKEQRFTAVKQRSPTTAVSGLAVQLPADSMPVLIPTPVAAATENFIQPTSAVVASADDGGLQPLAKKRKANDDGDGNETFTVKVHGRDNFRLICQMTEALEVASLLLPEERERLLTASRTTAVSITDTDDRSASSNIPIPTSIHVCVESTELQTEDSNLVSSSQQSDTQSQASTELMQPTIGRTVAVKREPDMASWLESQGISGCNELFYNHNVRNSHQLLNLSFTQLQGIGMSEDQLEIVWLAIPSLSKTNPTRLRK